MVDAARIAELTAHIAAEFHPARIVLFGSHARGKAGKDSDVDLLIILPFEGKAAAKAAEIRLKVRPGFPVDLVVRTPQKVRERLAMGDGFLRDILETGTVLYEADHARVG
jgi:predicted nucleotidyltransferase